MIETVLFDYVNTIAFLRPSREDILIEYFKKERDILLLKEDASELYTKLDEKHHYSSVTIRSAPEKKAFYDEYNKIIFGELQGGDHSSYYDFYRSVMKRWVLDESTLEVFNFLKNRGITIGILSNFDENLEEVLKTLGIRDMLDFIFVSAKIGLEKPDIKFYECAKNMYNIDVDRTIYVGDSYTLDYLPSRKVGLISYLIDRNNVNLKTENKIQDLNEIIRMVADVT